MNRLAPPLALAALLAASPALAEPRIEPSLGVELGQARERLSVELPGYSAHEDRWLLALSPSLGLTAWFTPAPKTPLRADATFAYGQTLRTGRGRLTLRAEALAAPPLGAKFSLLGGLGLALASDPSSAGRSAVELTLPLGVSLGSIELLYRPSLSLPLGAERSSVLGGSRELSARPGLVPLSLALRLRLPWLGFLPSPGGQETAERELYRRPEGA